MYMHILLQAQSHDWNTCKVTAIIIIIIIIIIIYTLNFSPK